MLKIALPCWIATTRLVQKLLPEDDWEGLGLHGLGERRLQKRIEALVRERLVAAGEFNVALRGLGNDPLSASAFAGEIEGAVRAYLPPPRDAGSQVHSRRTTSPASFFTTSLQVM